MVLLSSYKIIGVIPHYHDARKEQVVDSANAMLAGSLPVDAVYVFNNNPNYRLAFNNHKIIAINSGFNFGSSIRYAIAYASGAEYIVCCDDDLAVGKTDVEEIVSFLLDNPMSIVGYLGSIIEDIENPYIKRRSIVAKEPTEVDIVLGRLSGMTRECLTGYFSSVYDLQLEEYGNHEDIPFSMQNIILGNNNYVIPLTPTELGDRGVGLEFQEDHFPHRNELTRKFL